MTDSSAFSVPRLDDPAAAVLAGPGSTRVSCSLMQDTVAAAELSVAAGAKAGSLAGKAAPFANPFLDGKEEALVVNGKGQLTHLRRSPTETGWRQEVLKGADGKELTAAEVVVVVHHQDLSVWAIRTPGATGRPTALRLVGQSQNGVVSCRWEEVPGAIVFPTGPAWNGLSQMYVYYDGRIPMITGHDPSTGRVVTITAVTGELDFIAQAMEVSFSAGGTPDALVAGRAVRPGPSKVPAGPTVYLQFKQNLVRYNVASGEEPRTIAGDVKRLVGVYHAYTRPDLGVIYLDADGDLVTWHEASEFPVVTTKTPGLRLETATSWLDMNRMSHVYGVERGTGALKALHQVAWKKNSQPVWSQSKVWTPPATEPAVTVPTCVGLVAKVAAFVVDPYPDTQPNQLVKAAGTPDPDELYSFYAQDIASALWARDKVRLPSQKVAGLASHYVSTITLLDRRGTPMPAQTVKISAETLAEIRVDGASYLVGPGLPVALPTNLTGSVTISTPADSLIPATLHVDAVGLVKGAVVQPAAAVHDYLAGTGTLPSQKGVFDTTALETAEVNGERIARPRPGKSIANVVTSTQQVFKLADGSGLRSRQATGDRPAPAIHGFACGPTPGLHADSDTVPIGYTEFHKPGDAQEYIRQIRAMPEYGGIWDDFLNWAGDVWQGIKDGAIKVYNVVAEAVTTVFIYIGEKIVELVGLVIDTVQTAVRVVESVLRQVIDTVALVVDWLAALFAFKDIWETKLALQDGLKTMLSYGDRTVEHFGDLADDWFQRKRAEVMAYFESLKKEYAGRPLGDGRNQMPTMTDASGHGLEPHEVRDDPQGMWLMNQTFGAPAVAAAFAAQREAEHAPPKPLDPSPIGDAFESFLNALTGTGLGPKAERILGDLDVALTAIVDPRDPDGGSKASMVALIDILQTLVEAVLEALDQVVVQAVALARAVAAHLDDILDIPLPLGPVNVFYTWLQEQNEVANPEPLTLGALVMLLAAFTTTTSYKLVNGVDQTPFPGGRFPDLAPPPWHPAFQGYQPPQTYEDLRDKNAALRRFQVALGLMGMAGGVSNTIADLIPVLGDSAWPLSLQQIVAGCNAFFSASMFGYAYSIPDVTGSAWSGGNAGLAWSAASLFSFCDMVLSWGTIAWNVRGGDTPIMRNISLVTVGPIISCLLAVATGVATLTACVKDGVNPYTSLVNMSGTITGGIQPLRFGVREGNGPDKLRAGIVAVVDFIATETASTMLWLGAMLSSEPVIERNLPKARVGEEYSETLKASHGDAVFNKPLHAWKVMAGQKPSWLKINDEGKMSGKPSEAGLYRFSLSCANTYGPPQYSEITEVTLEVLPKAGRLNQA